MLNITRETMYPGLEESVKAVMKSHRQQRQPPQQSQPEGG